MWRLVLLLGVTDGFLYVRNRDCVFNSSHPDDIQFIDSYFYNKLEFLRFDSAVGRYQGFTDFGVMAAHAWNRNASIIKREREQKETYCVNFTRLWYSSILHKSAEPYAVLTTAPSVGSERVLVCSVYNFYPKHISVTWTNHSGPVQGVVTTTGPRSDSDWYYQVHSHLEYTPRSGDQISCVIQHQSLKNPLVLDYRGALSDVDRNMWIFGACGLVLGLILSLSGFLFYKHKTRGLMLVPQN